MAKVPAYDKITGKKHLVPAHFLDHPVLGKNLAKTPRIKARERLSNPEVADPTPAQPVEVAGDETAATAAKE